MPVSSDTPDIMWPLKNLVIYAWSYGLRILDWIQIALSRRCRVVASNDVKIELIRFPSRDSGRYIRAYRYTPANATGKLPVYLHWHASGWILKRLGIDIHLCSRISKELNCVVLECDYRKAPENKYPAAHNDTEDAVLYVLANEHAYDTTRISVGGSSAGGNMALSLSARLGSERIKSCFALYPAAHLTHPERLDTVMGCVSDKFRSGVVIPHWCMKLFINAYTTPGTDMNDPRLSPMFYDASKFPKYVAVACGDADTLYRMSFDLMKKISGSASGTNVDGSRKFICVLNEAHEFNTFGRTRASQEERDRVEGEAINMIRASWRQ